MSLSTAAKIVNFVFSQAGSGDKIEIGFFGGEPLLELDLIKKITDLIQNHPAFDANRVNISIVTNGTIYSDAIMEFLEQKNLGLCLSCDGPAAVQNLHRRFKDGSGSSATVEANLKKALRHFPLMPVNAVYSPETLCFLPDVVDYLVSLGAVNIYLNPNISAHWTQKEADLLPAVYGLIGKKYVEYYLQGKPKFINLIDSKITVILRGGYQPVEKCLMGQKEFAFAPSGNIYPCERLVGSDDGKNHCLGNINDYFKPSKNCGKASCAAVNLECSECGLVAYCANWCGCTNFHSTGKYNKVGPFICASEKAAITTAYDILELMKDNQQVFAHHLAGTPLVNALSQVLNKTHAH